MYLTKKAILNLASSLNDTDLKDDDLVILLEVSKRPYCVIGPADKYGKEPVLAINDVEVWNLL